MARCPTELDGGRQVAPGVVVAGSRALVRFPSWALLVEDGRTATVEWDGQADEASPAWIVDSWAVTLAMLQRGHLCLHATLVRLDDRVVALAGASGAGKSTTAMALRARGHQLLTDDVAIVDLRDGAAWVLPYRRSVHLLPDAAAAIGIDIAPLPGIAEHAEKSAVPVDDVPIERQHLDMVVLLSTRTGAAGVTLRHLSGNERLAGLLEHAGRSRTAPAIMGEGRYFTALTEVGRLTPVALLERPAESWSLDEVVTLIETSWPAPSR